MHMHARTSMEAMAIRMCTKLIDHYQVHASAHDLLKEGESTTCTYIVSSQLAFMRSREDLHSFRAAGPADFSQYAHLAIA